jgi:hypothetical protein
MIIDIPVYHWNLEPRLPFSDLSSQRLLPHELQDIKPGEYLTEGSTNSQHRIRLKYFSRLEYLLPHFRVPVNLKYRAVDVHVIICRYGISIDFN